jgi:hypothetical protein
VRALVQELRDREMVVVEATSADDGQAVVLSDPSLQGILLGWTLSDDDAASLHAKVMRKVDELIWMLEDTTFFIIADAYSVHHGDNHAHADGEAEAVNA